MTDRFLVRKLKQEDFDPFFEMQSNENVMQHIKAPLNHEECVAELAKFINYYSDPNRFYNLWAVESKETQDFIGMCGVYQNESKEYEIAYRFKERYWGKGIGREVISALVNHCMVTLKLDEIVAFVYEENIGSVKLLDGEMRLVEKAFSESRNRHYRKYVLKQE